MRRVHDHDVGSIAHVHEDGGGRRREILPIGVEKPVHEAVRRLRRCRRQRARDPLVGQQLAILPLPASQREVAEARHVVRIDEQSTAPVAAARHRLHGLSVHQDPRRFVPGPLPGGGGADRLHDVLAQHRRQRTAPDLQRGQRQHVHTHIVVLVHSARCDARPCAPLGRCAGGPVGPIRLAPEGSLPIAHLPEHVLPGDAAIVHRGEQIEWRHRAGARTARQRHHRTHVSIDGVVETANEFSIVGDADHGREKALRHAVGHVDAIGFAPFRDDVAVAQDHPGGFATIGEWSDAIAIRLTPEGPVVILLHAARVLDLARDGEGDGRRDTGGIHADLLRRPMLPRSAGLGEVRRGSTSAGALCAERREGDGGDNDATSQSPEGVSHDHVSNGGAVAGGA